MRLELFYLPQRIERGRCEEHREDHEIHHTREVLKLLDQRGEQHAERPEHEAGENERGQHRQIADKRRLDIPKPGDGEKDIGLEDRDQRSSDQLGAQEKPARERADEQGAHVAHFAVVNHRERRLHAVEKLDHRDKARHDIDLIEHIGLVRRDDRHAEDLAESGGENEQPYQRADERRHEALALMQEAQAFAPDDALGADEVLAQGEARAPDIFVGKGGHGLRLSGVTSQDSTIVIAEQRVSTRPQRRPRESGDPASISLCR